MAPQKVLGEKDFIIRYPLPSNPIINVYKKDSTRMDEDYTYTTPDPFNQVYAYISIEVIFVEEMKIKLNRPGK